MGAPSSIGSTLQSFQGKIALSSYTDIEIMLLMEHTAMADATIDAKSVCRNSGSARSKNYCGSGHLLKQWHERDTWVDSIFHLACYYQ